MRVVGIMRYLIGALCLQELVDQGEDVVGVVASSLDPYKGMPLEESVKLTANRNYLPVYQLPMRDVNKPEFIEILRRLKPDLIVSAYPPVTFRKEILEIPPLGVINLHPSRLPAGRGFATSIYHMLIGEEKNWITLHYVDPGVDTGDIIIQGSVNIAPEDTGFTVRRKLFEEARRIFAEALPLIRDGKAPRTPQTQIKNIEPGIFNWHPSYARIQWEKTAKEIANRVRTLTHPKDFAFDTDPTYTYLGGKRVSVWGARVVDGKRWENMKTDPGEILAISGEGVLVKTGRGVLLITDADMEGAEGQGLIGLIDVLRSGLPAILG